MAEPSLFCCCCCCFCYWFCWVGPRPPMYYYCTKLKFNFFWLSSAQVNHTKVDSNWYECVNSQAIRQKQLNADNDSDDDEFLSSFSTTQSG